MPLRWKEVRLAQNASTTSKALATKARSVCSFSLRKRKIKETTKKKTRKEANLHHHDTRYAGGGHTQQAGGDPLDQFSKESSKKTKVNKYRRKTKLNNQVRDEIPTLSLSLSCFFFSYFSFFFFLFEFVFFLSLYLSLFFCFSLFSFFFFLFFSF